MNQYERKEFAARIHGDGIVLNDKNGYEHRGFSARIHKNGIVISDKKEDYFLILRCAGDLENLKRLINSITMSEGTL